MNEAQQRMRDEVAARMQSPSSAGPHAHGVVKPGWYCSREAGHDGPCAAWPIDHEALLRETATPSGHFENVQALGFQGDAKFYDVLCDGPYDWEESDDPYAGLPAVLALCAFLMTLGGVIGATLMWWLG